MAQNPRKMADGRDLKAYILDDGAHYIEARVKFSRFGISSTQGIESMNAAPGAMRSPHGGGFHRYRHPVYACIGFVVWYLSGLHRL